MDVQQTGPAVQMPQIAPIQMTDHKVYDIYTAPTVSGGASAPSFNKDWRTNILMPDGTVREELQFHKPAWLNEWWLRQIFKQSDLLYRFAQMVATLASTQIDNYVIGGERHASHFESAFANQLETMAKQHMKSGLPSVKTGMLDKIKPGLARMIQSSGPGERLSRFQTPGMTVTATPELTRLASTGLLGQLARETAPAPAEKEKAPSATIRQAPPPLIPQVPSNVFPGVLQQPELMTDAPPTYRVEPIQPTVQQGAAVPAAPSQKSDQPVHGKLSEEQMEELIGKALEDKKSMLAFLLMRGGATETELKLVSRLFEGTEEMNDLDFFKTESAKLDYFTKLEQLIRRIEPRGHGDIIDDHFVPEHLGRVIFTPLFLTAVERAVECVHNLCGKQFALEIDLMTHSAVRTQFAELVAHYATGPLHDRASRFGGGSSAERHASARQRRFHALVELFKTLREIEIPDPHPLPGKPNGKIDVLAFSCVPYAEAARSERAKLREQYERERGRYYSDMYQPGVELSQKSKILPTTPWPAPVKSAASSPASSQPSSLATTPRSQEASSLVTSPRQ